MIIHIEGSLKRSYCETLALLFYPGTKFPKDEEPGLDSIISTFKTNTSDGSILAEVTIEDHGRTARFQEKRPISVFESEEQGEIILAGIAYFRCGQELTGKCPPWGILTGVRPAKVSSKYLDKGLEESAVQQLLQELYLVQPNKAKILTSISKTENRLVSSYSPKDCSVYIAIPFCPTRCSYCSFISFASPKLLNLIPDYLTLLLDDLHRTFEMIRKNDFNVKTIYIGGGTPTTLNEEQLKLLLSAINQEMDITNLEEFTLEAGRPDTITEEKLAIAKAYGVTRVSVNPQTLNDEVLKKIGRRHTSEQFLNAYEMARNSKIRDINVDLIAGLDSDTFESFQNSIDGIISLNPTNITVHTFSVKNAAEIRRDNAEIYHESPRIASDSVAYSQKVLLENSYLPYYIYRQKNMLGNLENVGYSKSGHEGLYNVYMMEEIHSIFGVGASSVTKFLKYRQNEKIIERFYEPKYPYEYLSDNRAERWAAKEAQMQAFFEM